MMSLISAASYTLLYGGSSSSSYISSKRQIDDLSTASVSTCEKWVGKNKVSEDSSPCRQINLRSCEGIIVNPIHQNISTPLMYFHKYGDLCLSKP